MSSRGKRMIEMALAGQKGGNNIPGTVESEQIMPLLKEFEADFVDPFSCDDDDLDPDYVPNNSDMEIDEESAPSQKQNKILVDAGVEADVEEVARVEPSCSLQPIIVPSRRCRQIRNDRKEKRNTGQSYTTETGKFIRDRYCIQELPNCRMKCNDHFKFSVRKKLFDKFWEMNSRDRRADYLNGLITSQPKATERLRRAENSRIRTTSNKYHLKVDGDLKPICKSCFQKCFDLTDGFIKVLLLSRGKNSGSILKTDQRGQHATITKTTDLHRSEVERHINSFPRYESHYSRRHTAKEYLSADLNIAKLYELYKEQNEPAGNVVSYGIYRQIFKGMKLSFKLPHNDTCNTCDTFILQIKLANNIDEKSQMQIDWDQHKEMSDKHYLAKKADKENAKTNKDTKMISFDLQQVLQTPHIQTSIMFYKRQLAVYNLTIYDGATGIANNFLWDETLAGRGANQIGSCLFKYLIQLPEEVKNVVMYSDTCTGQNRNSHIVAIFFCALQANPTLQTIDHKFMISGHSHMECDTAHAMIEKHKKRTKINIHHPRDWSQLIRCTGKDGKFLATEMAQVDFLDSKTLYKKKLQIKKKDAENNKFIWHDAQWLRCSKDSIGVMQFKTSLDIDKPFKTISFLRRGQDASLLAPKPQYKGTVPISKEKKSDLMSILHLVDPIFHDFYKNIPVRGENATSEDDEDNNLFDN